MATGSITSLGIGSGLDLQDIIDQLKEVDEAPITAKQVEQAELQTQVDAYNTVNAKLFSVKSDALNLSLASNFLANSASISDEDILSATVGDGYEESSYSVDVTQKAQRNSWASAGVESKTDVMFAEPASGIVDAETTQVTTQSETLSVFYGAAEDQQQIDISLDSGLTLAEITDEINNSSNNKDADGNQLVSASFTLGDNGDYSIRLSATSGGNSADSEINVAGFDWVAADTTVVIAQGDDTMYLSVPPGTSYEGAANLINGSEDNPGVTAAMIDNGDSVNPYQFTLTSDDTGEDARLSLTNLAGLTEVTGARAQLNSWTSAGVESETDVMFAEPASGIVDADTTQVTTQSETLSVFYGAAEDQQQIDISLDSGLTLAEITDEINNSSNNKDADGNQLVSASFTLGDNGDYSIRLSATSGGNSADSEINVAGFDWVAADTTVVIAQGDDTMYLSVPPGTSYEETANLINGSEDNPGVTAAMINNGDSVNPYQLTLTSDDTGEDAKLSLTNLDGLTEVTGVGEKSLNAEFTVNGISYSRQSNTAIDDVITGVTFDLKNIGESTLNIEVNHDTVKEDILSMIEGFNDLVSYITGTDEDSSDTESETGDDTDNPFEGSSNARRLVSQLQSLLTTSIDLDSAYTSLIDLGLEIAKDGTISIDEDTLDEAIAVDPDALEMLFLGDEDEEITGIADIINDALSEMVSSTGIASTEIDEAEAKIDRLDQSIENETERLTKRYEIMSAAFSRLDTYVSQLNSEASLLTSLFDSFSTSSDD